MGLYNGNLGNYYSTPSLETLGGYQFISITDIINNFMVVYVGEDKILPRVSRADVRFHASRAIQELTYDTFRSCKALELEVPPSMKLPLPHDYVNYVKITSIGSHGECYTLQHCKSCPKDPISYEQNTDGTIYVGDENTFGEIVIQDPTIEDSTTWASQSSSIDDAIDYSGDNLHVGNLGRRYGLDTSRANINGCFFINCRNGQIYFDSSSVGKTITIQYISDGVANDGEMLVHKFAEEAMYKWIIYAIISTSANSDPRIETFKRERTAAIRNAKLRLSNIRPEELTQVLRGLSQWIKH